MFRLPAARLRQLASPPLKRGAFRAQTNTAEQALKRRQVQKPFWNSGRVLLFSALTGSTAYYYGGQENVSWFQFPWNKFSKPHYASKSEMEKAG